MPATELQDWSPDRYAANARFVPDLGRPVVALLAPVAGERILDLGCGDGALTVELVRAGAEVVGVDASQAMVRAARAAGLDARVMDGAALAFNGEFDAVFSNAALHWMTAPERVVAGVYRALKPGGRFVGEFGGHGNIAAIATAIRAVLAGRDLPVPDDGPWFFPTADAYRALLEAAGFTADTVELFARPTPLPTGLAAWLTTFADAYLGGLGEAQKTDVIEDVCRLLAPSLCDGTGQWTADYVRLRFTAVRPR